MRPSPSLLGFLPLLAAAQTDNYVGGVGVISPGGPSAVNASLKATELAGRHPNGTASTTFQRLVDETQETWTWRVNVTDIAVPNEPTNLGMSSANSSEHLHIVNTQWELQWPDNNNASESFTDFLRRIDSRAYFNAMILNLPSNITRAYSNQTNGNCTAVLGDDCVRSIESAASTGNYLKTSDLTGCASTLNVARPGTGADLGFGKIVGHKSVIGFDILIFLTSRNQLCLDRSQCLFARATAIWNSILFHLAHLHDR